MHACIHQSYIAYTEHRIYAHETHADMQTLSLDMYQLMTDCRQWTKHFVNILKLFSVVILASVKAVLQLRPEHSIHIHTHTVITMYKLTLLKCSCSSHNWCPPEHQTNDEHFCLLVLWHQWHIHCKNKVCQTHSMVCHTHSWYRNRHTNLEKVCILQKFWCVDTLYIYSNKLWRYTQHGAVVCSIL